VVRSTKISGQSDEPLFRQENPLNVVEGCSQKVSRRACKVKQRNRL
jgi:hypothetical protein